MAEIYARVEAGVFHPDNIARKSSQVNAKIRLLELFSAFSGNNRIGLLGELTVTGYQADREERSLWRYYWALLLRLYRPRRAYSKLPVSNFSPSPDQRKTLRHHRRFALQLDAHHLPGNSRPRWHQERHMMMSSCL